jgi:hypothetical protein
MPRAVLPFLFISLALCFPSHLEKIWTKDSGIDRIGSIHENLPVGASTNITFELDKVSFSVMVIN